MRTDLQDGALASASFAALPAELLFRPLNVKGKQQKTSLRMWELWLALLVLVLVRSSLF